MDRARRPEAFVRLVRRPNHEGGAELVGRARARLDQADALNPTRIGVGDPNRFGHAVPPGAELVKERCLLCDRLLRAAKQKAHPGAAGDLGCGMLAVRGWAAKPSRRPPQVAMWLAVIILALAPYPGW